VKKIVLKNLFGLLVAVVGLLCLHEASASTLKKSDIEQIFSHQYTVGELNPNVPVWPLFLKSATDANTKPTLFGYAFESVDFEPVRGYGGKPINILVAIDTQGNFLESKLISHREPLFRSEVGIAKLTEFAAQYKGLSIHHDIQLYDHKAKTSRDDKNAALHGVQAGTVTVKAIDRTILQSATSVALAHQEAAKTGNIVGAGNAIALSKGQINETQIRSLHPAELEWRGMVQISQITRGQIEKAFIGTRAVGADKLAAKSPDDIALQFHVALVSLPAIGRNILDDEGWRLVAANRRDSHALMVIESGPLAKMMYESQRIADDVPFVLKQNGKTIGLRSIAYDKGVKVPGYPTQTRAHFLIIDTATPLDPTQPFNLTFKLGRRFGTFPNQKAYVEFPLPYYFHGWRQVVSNYLDADWVGTWIKRSGEIATLLIALTLLSIALIRQHKLTATTKRLKQFRVGFLLFTLIGIGWIFQGQLSIVNITAAIDSIASGNDLSFFLTDPITVILWIFVGFTLFIWGRGTFCGWLCPFGAFQELVSKSMRFIGLRHKRIRPSIDRKLKWIKYILLVSLLSMLFISPSTTEIGVEVEPFKTAISLYFVRDWPYVLWAVTCLSLSVVVYRGYCRYICPLGAALAAFNPLRKWGWIARRTECGTPCQTCRSRCDYQAIDQVGKISYSECFQCMDCVAIYQDKKQCLPLVKEIKRQHIVIQIHAVTGNL